MYKNLIRFIWGLGFCLSFNVAFAQESAAPAPSVQESLSAPESLFRGDLYSESNYLPTYGLLSETRLRYNFWQRGIFKTYFGIAHQRQDFAGGKEDIYIPSLSPMLGVRVRLLAQLHIFAEYRQWITNIRNKINSQADPRFGVFAGDFLNLKGPFFAEYYGEWIAVPRVSRTSVSTLWLKLGLRQPLAPSFYIDPYAEFFVRHTKDLNLGVETSEGRAGLRLLYAPAHWSAAVLVYEAFRENEVQGLFVVGAEF